MPTIPTNLQEGKTNVSAGANMTDSMITTGGVMPYVYSLEGTDVAKFTINSTTGRVGVGSTALTAGTYSFTIKVTDKSAKTATQAITLNVAVAEAGIPISASVVGAFQITYTEENIVINLTAPIEGLTDSDIKAYKNGSIISNVIPTRSDTNDKITLKFLAITGINYKDNVNVKISKTGYSINDGNPIVIPNDIPGYTLTMENGIVVSPDPIDGKYGSRTNITIKAVETAGKVFKAWESDVYLGGSFNPSLAETSINMPASNIKLTAIYVDKTINIDGTTYYLSPTVSLPAKLSWDDSTNILTMNEYQGSYIHYLSLNNITINLIGDNKLSAGFRESLLIPSIVIKGTGTLTLESSASRAAYRRITIKEAAKVKINKDVIDNSTNNQYGIQGDVNVEENGRLEITISPQLNKSAFYTFGTEGINIKDNATVKMTLIGEVDKNNTVLIANNIPSIQGKRNGSNYENSAYRVSAEWSANQIDPIKLKYTVPNEVSTLNAKANDEESNVYIKLSVLGELYMYTDSSFAESVANMAISTGDNIVYVKTIIGTEVKFYEITVVRDDVDTNPALLAADKALIEAGSYEIPLADQTDQTTKTAWVQAAVNAKSVNGTVATVTWNTGTNKYDVVLVKGTVNGTATITVTEKVDSNVALLAADKALIEVGSYEIPLANQTDQAAKTAWIQAAVNAKIANGTVATVTWNTGTSKYNVALVKGAVNGTATITVTEESKILLTSITDIIGEAKNGEVLTAGEIVPEGATVTYQWWHSQNGIDSWSQPGGSQITNKKTYAPNGNDTGLYIRVQVTGIGNYFGVVHSNNTALVACKDISSDVFKLIETNNTLKVKFWSGARFKEGIVSSDFIFEGDDAVALASGIFTRIDDQTVEIKHAVGLNGVNNKVTVKGTAQIKQSEFVSVEGSFIE